MKTLREILLEKHRGANPRLDAIRREVLSRRVRPSAAPVRARPSWPDALWAGLIAPSRRGWTALAGVWVAIAFMRVLAGSDSPGSRPAPDNLSASTVAQIAEQNALRTELLASGPVSPALPAKQTPGPQGMVRPDWISA